MRVFICHSEKDVTICDSVEKSFKEKKVPCWRSEGGLPPGTSLGGQLRKNIEKSDVCFFVATQNSTKSEWCRTELSAFWGARKQVVIYIGDRTTSAEDVPVQFRQQVCTRDIGKAVEAAIDALKRSGEESLVNRPASVLVIGQTCWDQFVVPPPELTPEPRIGGSTYYGTHAVLYMAKHMRCQVSIDLLAPLGTDDKGDSIEQEFRCPGITTYFWEQSQTLCIENEYPDPDYTNRNQKVQGMPGSRISRDNVNKKLVENLREGLYDIVFLLPLTPYDFVDIASDMVPFLRGLDSTVRIGVDLQGLVRGVHFTGGAVTQDLSQNVPVLIKKHALSCVHATIKEALFVVEELARLDRVECKESASDPGGLARALCKHRIPYVGVTDGGKGSWVAWQNPDGGEPFSQYIETPNLKGISRTVYATGAGDTWFGIFAYILFGLRFPPIVAGSLATQFATLKCQKSTAL